MVLVLVFLLGVVSGLRTFTGPAVLWIMRHGGIWAYVLGAAALFEYFFDVSPKAPARTSASNIIARVLSGAFVGWFGAVAGGALPTAGLFLGILGAIVGTYVSSAIRKWCIGAIGNVPSGIIEDIVTVIVAALLVARL